MVLIIPEYELKGKMIELLRGSFSFRYAFRSEEYAAFKQVIIFLTRARNNELDPKYRMRYNSHYDNLDNTPEDPIVFRNTKPLTLDVDVRHSGTRPLLQSKDLTDFYTDCESRLDTAVRFALDKEYPSSYDTSILPASTLRTAHAVQLAAMNSQIESVTINGEHFLAKYMVISQGGNLRLLRR